MSGPSQIDLGVYRFDPDSGPEGCDPPGRSWPEWRRLRRVPPRRWLAALLVPVLLFTVDSVPRQPSLVPLWEAPSQLIASGATGYGLVPSGDGATIAAYRLADGEVRWKYRAPGVGWAGLSLVGDTLLVSNWSLASVVALDAATGQERWWREDRFGFTVAERWLFLTVSDGVAGGDIEILGDDVPYEVAMVDTRTGEAAWTGRWDPSEEALYEVTGYLLTSQPSGRLTRYDPATGGVLAAAETGRGRPRIVTVVDDLVMITDPAGVAAYELETLRERWRLDAVDGWAAACGTLVCAYGDRTLHGLDPQTGEARWSRRCDDLAEDPDPPAGPAVCHLRPPISDAVPVLPRLTATTVTYLTLDPATGDLGAELTGWWPTGLRRGDRTLMISLHLGGGAGPQSWLGWWRPGSSAVDLVGPVTATQCGHLTGDYLLCGRADPVTGDMIDARVWRVG